MSRTGHIPPQATGPIEALRGLRRALRAMLISRAAALVLSCVIGALIVGGVLDFVLRPPAVVRWIGLFGAVAALVWLVRRELVPALRFHPSLTTLALRAAPKPEIGRRTASGVDLARERLKSPEDELPASLRVRGVSDALGSFDRATLKRMIRWRDWTRAAVLVGSLAIFAGVIASQWPGATQTALARLVMPWSDAEWPRRFPVVDLTRLAVHPTDAALPIRAAVVRAPGSDAGLVEAHYRIVRGDGLLARPGPTQRVMLTDQGRFEHLTADTDPLAEPEYGTLFERLIEPGPLVGRQRAGDDVFLEYWLTTSDDRSETTRVRLVEPPEMVSAVVSITPPMYALPGIEQAGLVSGPTVFEEQAAIGVGPVLAGSRVTIDAVFNKDLPIEDKPAWIASLAAAADGPVVFEPAGDSVRIEATLRSSATIRAEVRDAYGIEPRDPITIAIDTLADEAPRTAITTPMHDEAVLAGATIELVAEGRDDLGVARLSIERAVARPPTDSAGAPPEPGEPVVILNQAIEGSPARAEVRTMLELGPLELIPGDEVRIETLVTDTLASALGTREPVRSRTRLLRVIAEEELSEQIRGELSGLRRTIVRLDEEQRDLEALAADGVDRTPPISERQEALSDRIETQRRLIERLRDRQGRNALEDPSLRGLLGDSEALLDAARAASDDAAVAQGRAQNAAPESDEQRDAQQDAEDARRTVRDNLGRLAELLDRGEDGWLVRRSFERLLTEQQRLRDATAAQRAETVGKSLDDLSNAERAALDRIAQRQREAAEQAQAAIDELAERAEELAEADPAQSAAMSAAASRARQAQLAEQLDDAAQQLSQNQTGLAQEQQEEAIESLEEVLERLDQADQARDAALRRQLASIVQSIESLVRRQERELERLETGEPIATLDRGMIELNRNTLAVRTEAASEPSFAPVSDLLGRAASAQSDAIGIIRGANPNAQEIDRRERASLLALRRALDEAQQQLDEAEQAEADRKRREVRQAYREALEEQAALTSETAPLVGQRLSRRERATSRALGGRQDELRGRVAQIMTLAEEIAEARVFSFAHRRLEQLMSEAGASLSAGTPDDRTARQQQGAVELLASLVEALAGPKPSDDPFDSGAQASGAGGQGGQGGQQGEPQPLVPPIAELMVLRAMQEQARSLTRSLDESATPPTTDDLADAASLQTDIAQHAAELIEQMRQPEAPMPEITPGVGPENEQPDPSSGSEGGSVSETTTPVLPGEGG
ncbi:MAG: hypothetical protein RIB60_02040 [Phycisphaerales bacterium]